MAQLTTKELAYIEDEVRAEEITAKTLNWCAAQCEDQALKMLLEEVAQQHQLKVADISKYFNRSRMVQ